LILLACVGPSSDIEIDAEAQRVLALGDEQGAAEVCAAIRDQWMRADCVWSVAMELAPRDPQGSMGVCSMLDSPALEECAFLAAERAVDPALCEEAGDYAAPCRNHLAHLMVEAAVGQERLPGAVEGLVLTRIAPHELPERDWPRLYQVALSVRDDLSPSHCAQATYRPQCGEAVSALYDIAIEELVENGKLRCSGPWPGRVQGFDPEAFGPLVEAARTAGRCSAVGTVGGGNR